MQPSTDEILDEIEKKVRQLINVKNYRKLFFDIEIDNDLVECNYGYVDLNNKVYLDHSRKMLS